MYARIEQAKTSIRDWSAGSHYLAEMKTTTLILSLFASFLVGCTSDQDVNPKTDSTKETPSSKTSRNPNYPYSEIELIYDTVLDAMTKDYFKYHPDLDKQHTRRLQEFIRKEYSKDKFVSLMIHDEAVEVFKRAMANPKYRDTKEFKDTFIVVVNTSVPLARMIVGNARDLYVAKFVDKNPVKLELFEMARSEEDKQYIASVYGEVTREQYEKDEFAGDYDFEEGDRIFGFFGGDWENLTGRQGYIVVRKGKICDACVTVMN